MRRPATITLLAAAALCAAAGGCAITTTPGGGVQTQWIGQYARQQAADQNRERALALRVRRTIDNDPVLAPLDLDIFVDHGTVRLCGDYPDPASRSRAAGLVATIPGVSGVVTHCGTQ